MARRVNALVTEHQKQSAKCERRSTRTSGLAFLQRLAVFTRGEGHRSTYGSSRHIRAFTEATRNKLLDGESGFGKAHLGLLVREVTVGLEDVTMRGSKATLAAAVAGIAPSGESVQNSRRARDANVSAIFFELHSQFRRNVRQMYCIAGADHLVRRGTLRPMIQGIGIIASVVSANRLAKRVAIHLRLLGDGR